MKTKLLLLNFFTFITFTFSQENFVITNVRIFDGETVKENAYVLIENGLISKVSTNKIIHNNVIDGTGKTLIPDMTNAHVHVWAVFSLQEAAKERVLNLLDIHRRGNART